MDLKHSRRILMVGSPNSSILGIVKDLTGSAPTPNADGSIAGLSHEWDVRTAYYTARVPIWIDEIANVDAWRTEFLKPEAKEVVEAVGAWVYFFNKPENGGTVTGVSDVLNAIQDVSEEHAGFGADVVMLAVAVPSSKGAVSSDAAKDGEWEDSCLEYGFEYIDYTERGTNELREKVGFDRLKEALEANDWAVTTTEEDDLDFQDLDLSTADDLDGSARDEAEMTAELYGMKAALAGSDIESNGEDLLSLEQQGSQVEDLDKLMSRLLAVKEQSANLPEGQRRRMAAQAVRDLLKDSGT